MKLFSLIALPLFLLLAINPANSQEIDYLSPKKYRIVGVKVDGAPGIDPNTIILLSGLSKGDEITVPGDDISGAIKKLWDQDIFSDVEILQEKVIRNDIWLIIKVKQFPKLSDWSWNNTVSKSEGEDLEEMMNVYPSKIVTENLKANIRKRVRNYFRDKGFRNTSVRIETPIDTTKNNFVYLSFFVDKGEKIKINDIIFHGNEALSDGKLRRAMRETKIKRWYRIFKKSKLLSSTYKEDKQAIIALYNQMGMRDARITRDTIYQYDDKTVNIEIWLEEGNKYYFRNFDWIGNTKYSSGFLDTLLGINKGDVFNKSLLESRLYMDPAGRDITSQYMNKGYLFFQLNPVEKYVEGDSIDYDIMINEGKEAYIKDVRVFGNTKTNDHVIYREIRTRPGDLFNRNDIIRTQQELNNTGYFNPEAFNVNPIPDPVNGTVDIDYTVEEKPSDQIELSGGWGAGRIVGTLGLVFNNFSVRNMFKKGAWRPLPSGDGQRLSIRAQSNGSFWQSYNFSFTEPWLGGKKPNAFSVSAYHSIQSNGVGRNEPGRQQLSITGLSVSLGRRNKWPDDYFINSMEIGYQRFNVKDWGSIFVLDSGKADAYYFQFKIQRNSIDKPLYPTRGSKINFSGKLTPPWSWFDGVDDYSELSAQDRYKRIEYNKWKFTASWFNSLNHHKNKLVLNARIGFGFLHYYTEALGAAPFERFYLGGSGLTGFNIDGREIIALRGYDDQAVSPQQGGVLISKYTMELRYPLSLNPQATVYILGFAEAGNTWNNFKEFNPFAVKRSAGVGVRIFLPMFGLMGLDYGWGFDRLDQGAAGFQIPGSGQFHFTIGMNLGEL